MTRDDIIRMASEAGLGDGLLTGKSIDGESGIWINLMSVRGVLERFSELVAAAEREACAKVCDEAEKRKWLTVQNGGRLDGVGARDCAAAIRARGEK